MLRAPCWPVHLIFLPPAAWSILLARRMQGEDAKAPAPAPAPAPYIYKKIESALSERKLPLIAKKPPSGH